MEHFKEGYNSNLVAETYDFMSEPQRLKTFLVLRETGLQDVDDIAEFLKGDNRENQANLHHNIIPKMQEYGAVELDESQITVTADEMVEDRVSYLSEKILTKPSKPEVSETSEIQDISKVGEMLRNSFRLETLLYMEDNQNEVYSLEEISEAAIPKYHWPKTQLHHNHIPKLEKNNAVVRNDENIHHTPSDILQDTLQYELGLMD